jgi:hypothetical protein
MHAVASLQNTHTVCWTIEMSRSWKQAVMTRLPTTMANGTLPKILFPLLKTKATRTGTSKGVISCCHSRTTTALLQWCGSQRAQFALHPRSVLAKCGVHVSAVADLRGEGETRHRIFLGHANAISVESAHAPCCFHHPLQEDEKAIQFIRLAAKCLHRLGHQAYIVTHLDHMV